MQVKSVKQDKDVLEGKELLMDNAEDMMRTGSHRSATFVIHVYSQENSTWQGRILWAENKESCMFRSALEMLKLIDGALENEG